MKQSLETISAGNSLSQASASALMNRLMQGEFGDVEIAGLLMALKTRGESSAEIAGFAAAMRANATALPVDVSGAVDCCGTGGDGAGSFNISTAAAIVAAAAGAKVAKHGNRSVSSQCGSADLLESAGVNIDPGVEQTAADFERIGMCFMFAPRFHPAMKYAMPARRALGVRTVFNMLGPLSNPAAVRRQLLGVYSKAVMPLFAEALIALDCERALIVHSQDGLDEISVSAPTDVIEIRGAEQKSLTLSPTDFGFELQPAESISGGSPAENLRILNSLLAGERVPVRPAVVCNASAAMYLADRGSSFTDCAELAATALDNGAARELLAKWIEDGGA